MCHSIFKTHYYTNTLLVTISVSNSFCVFDYDDEPGGEDACMSAAG